MMSFHSVMLVSSVWLVTHLSVAHLRHVNQTVTVTSRQSRKEFEVYYFEVHSQTERINRI